MVPHVVYHAAAMGNWQDVVREQMLTLRECGLAEALAGVGDTVGLTHVGDDASREWILAEAARHDVPMRVVRTDPNVLHYETFAMMEVERLAKVENTDRHILYFHTKGVSAPALHFKALWRMAMAYHTIHKWRENLVHIADGGGYDAVGMNWWDHGERHFSGTFWMARADWIRKLPPFVAYHHAKNLVRYSCELWIGSSPGCRAYSHGTMNAVVWKDNYDFSQVLPKSTPSLDGGDEITWVTAATPSYTGDLERLQKSFRLLGPGHRLVSCVLPEQEKWRHSTKLNVMRDVLVGVRTSHLFWIDADCEFLTIIRPHDVIHPAKPLSAVRHMAYNRPREILPDNLRRRLPTDDGKLYYQACLWGGRISAVAEIIERIKWIFNDPRGYDEHALNVEWCKIPDKLHTLPCRYAAPSNFKPFPQYEESYNARSDGAARIIHHNREIRQ